MVHSRSVCTEEVWEKETEIQKLGIIIEGRLLHPSYKENRTHGLGLATIMVVHMQNLRWDIAGSDSFTRW